MLKRTFRNSVISLGLLGVAACGGGATTAPTETKTAAADQAKGEAKVEEKKVAAPEPAPIQKVEDALPTKVTSLFAFVGKDAPIIMNVPRFDKVIGALDPETRDAITKEMLEKANKESKFEAAVAKNLLDSFEQAVIFSDPDKKNASGKEIKAAEEGACVAAKFRDPKPVELVLSHKSIERNGPRFTAMEKDSDKVAMHGVWFADSGVIIGCAKPEALSRSLAVATGSLPSYGTSPRFVAERANDLFVSVDMHPILGDKVEPGSDLFASLTTPGQSLGLDLRLNLYGASYPPVGSVVAPASQALVGQMPKGTIGAIGISLKRAAGKDLASVITLVDKATNGNKLKEIKEGAAQVGIEFADIDAALGDELAVGVYRNAKEKIDLAKSEGLKHTAVIVSIATKDEIAQKKIWTTLTDMAKKKRAKDVSIQANSIESVPKPGSKKNDFVRVESRKGVVVISVGDKSMVGEALKKFGKDTLASTPAFSEARAKEKPAVHLLGFLDAATLKSLVADKSTSDKPKAPGVPGGPAFLSLLLGPTDRGLELALGGGGAMELIGTGAKLALDAFKSYEADSKTAEVRMNVRFMSSYARNAFNNPNPDGKGKRGKFCKTAQPIPAVIPKGAPQKLEFSDWETGDDDTGWKCLHYFNGETTNYQYEYRQGGPYKGPARGGPNPGPNGFEVSAEGDVDGDGKTSLFTRTGKIVGGKVVLDDDIFISDPAE